MLRNRAYNPVPLPTFRIIFQLFSISLFNILNTMHGFCLPLPASPSRHRRHRRRFRKQAAKLNAAATAAVAGSPGFLFAGPAGSLSAASLAGFSEPAAAASAPRENLVRNRIEFRDFG